MKCLVMKGKELKSRGWMVRSSRQVMLKLLGGDALVTSGYREAFSEGWKLNPNFDYQCLDK